MWRKFLWTIPHNLGLKYKVSEEVEHLSALPKKGKKETCKDLKWWSRYRQPSCGASGCSGYVYLLIRLSVQKQYLLSLLDTHQPQRNSSGLHYSVWIFPHLPWMPLALFSLKIPSSTYYTAVFGCQCRQSCWWGKWMATIVCFCWVWCKTPQRCKGTETKHITGSCYLETVNALKENCYLNINCHSETIKTLMTSNMMPNTIYKSGEKKPH